MCGVLASVLLRTPLLRHLYFSLGLRAADSKSIKQIITREHASCQIIVGGIAEMFMADDPHYERVYLRRRTGCAPRKRAPSRPLPVRLLAPALR